MKHKRCIAMLLAGGQGSRLGILTRNIAKPAVDVYKRQLLHTAGSITSLPSVTLAAPTGQVCTMLHLPQPRQALSLIHI